MNEFVNREGDRVSLGQGWLWLWTESHSGTPGGRPGRSRQRCWSVRHSAGHCPPRNPPNPRDGLSFLYGNVCDREACHGPSPRSSGGGDAAGEEEGRLGSRDAGDTDRGEPTRRPRASATRAQGHAVGKRLRRKPLQLDARSPTRCANPPREGRPCAPVGDPLLGVPRAVAEDEVTTQGTPAPTLLSWSQSTPSLKSQHCVPDVSRPRTPRHYLPT